MSVLSTSQPESRGARRLRLSRSRRQNLQIGGSAGYAITVCISVVGGTSRRDESQKRRGRLRVPRLAKKS